MFLERHGTTLVGDYLYTKRGYPIELLGTSTPDGKFTLSEMSELVEKTAELRGVFSLHDGTLAGSWGRGAKRLPLVGVRVAPTKYFHATWAWKADLGALPVSQDVELQARYDLAGSPGFGGPSDDRKQIERVARTKAWSRARRDDR